jgi:NitT/TauT family transport system substrate-binding protein
MKRIPCIVFIALLLLFIIYGCSQQSATNNNGYASTAININVANAYTDIINLIIKEENLLQPYLPDDITVNWLEIFNSADIRDSALAGRLDIFSQAAPVAITAIENGLPIRILSNHVATYAAVISTKDHIRNLSDLTESSRITISSKGSSPHLAFALYCKDYFDDPVVFENNLISVPPADVLGLMLTSQDYDAYIKAFPALFQIPDDVDYHIIADLTPVALKYGAGTYIAATEDFIRNNPIFIEAYRRASEEAVDLILNDTERIAAVLAPIFGVELDILVYVIRRNPPRLEMSGYDEMATVLYEMGILASPPMRFTELPNYNDIPKEQ